MINPDNSMYEKPKKLFDQVRETMRIKHYSYRSEQNYIDWIRRYILFHDKRHPMEIGGIEIKQFITYRAVCLPRFKAFDRLNDQGYPPTPPGRKRAAARGS
jgi:hypothetical protein